MAGVFILELDTTPPIIEIYAPTYSDNQTNNEVSIVANEELMDYQDIYVIDGQGTRHDVIFLKTGDNMGYEGNIIFNDYPTGIATIYAQVMDTVKNISSLVSKNINIVTSEETLKFKMSSSVESRILSVYERESLVLIGGKEAESYVSEKELEVLLAEKEVVIPVFEKKTLMSFSEKESKVVLFEGVSKTIEGSDEP